MTHAQLKLEIEQGKTERTELASQLEAARQQVGALKSEIEQGKTERTQLASQIEAACRDATSFRKQVSDQNVEIAGLQQSLAKSLQEGRELNGELAEAGKTHTSWGSLFQRQRAHTRGFSSNTWQSEFIWQWQASDGTFVDFEAGNSELIEKYFTAPQSWLSRFWPLGLLVEGQHVDVSVARMESVKKGSTGRPRSIRRVDRFEPMQEPTWTSQTEPVQLVNVEPWESDYQKVVNVMFSPDAGSLGQDFVPKQVRRIQNSFLIHMYNAERKNTITLRGAAMLNETTVFHGTGKTNPESIALSKPGFMVEYSKESGFYGRGFYFSERPCYSHHYSHYTYEGNVKVFHLLVCRVICGASKNMGTELAFGITRCDLPASEWDSVVAGPHSPRFQGSGPDASVIRVMY